MSRYVTLEIGHAAAGETLVNALTGLGEKKRLIKSLTFSHVAYSGGGAIFSDLPLSQLRAYKNQDQVASVGFGSFNWAVFSDVPYVSDAKPILLDTVLEIGDGFKVGFFNATGAQFGNVVMEYEDKE
jgi:hypothetical protein